MKPLNLSLQFEFARFSLFTLSIWCFEGLACVDVWNFEEISRLKVDEKCSEI
jgi:hypothetical protein